MMGRVIFTFIWLTTSIHLQAQQILNGQGSEIDSEKVSNWLTTDLSTYQGVYLFGDSEWEYTVLVLISDGITCIQKRSSDWETDDNDKVIGRKTFYTNFSDVQIKGNNLISKSLEGKFVNNTDGLWERRKGLILKQKGLKSENETFDFGYKSTQPVRDKFSGKFPQASFKILRDEDIKSLSKAELQIMRNEIFARYGHIFLKGGKMESYFAQQSWYEPSVKYSEEFLTSIEKRNIQLIKSLEGG